MLSTDRAHPATPDRGSASHTRSRSWRPCYPPVNFADPTGCLSASYRHGLADLAGRQLVRLVGDGSQHGRRPPPARRATRRRDRRDQPARARHAIRPRRRPARGRRRHRLRRRRHAERGRDRDRRHRHRARRAARADRPTCSPARSACPTIRCAPSTCSPAGSTPATSARSASDASTVASSASTPASGTTPPSSSRSSGSASLKRWLGHPLFISAALTTWARGYDRHHPHFRLAAGDRAPPRRRLLLDRAQHQPVHVPRQPADRPLAGRHPRRPARRRHVPHAAGRADPRRARFGAARRRRAPVRAPRRVDGLSRSSSPSTTNRSRTNSTATTSATSSRLEFDLVPNAVRLVFPASVELSRFGRPRTARATSGTFVQMPSTPHAISSRMRSGSSHVHVLTAIPAA